MDSNKPRIIINDAQARKIAKAIFADIAGYVENHREELEQLLNEDNKKTGGSGR